MPDQVGHDGLVVGSPHRHSRENGNPWMSDQVGHNEMGPGMMGWRWAATAVIPVKTGIHGCPIKSGMTGLKQQALD